jgi:hypothetical protein
MVAGGFLMFFSEPINLKGVLTLTVLAAVTFGFTNVM